MFIVGKPVDIVWTKLAATANAGLSVIKVQDSVTWTNGDKIIIASTGPANSVVQNELHTVVSVAADGVTITINGTLQFDHLGVMEIAGSHSLEYRAEVGMLTRNIVIQGDRDPQWDVKIEACPAGFDVGE
jgi:cell migration-inducing and hyaluronan-binding protein